TTAKESDIDFSKPLIESAIKLSQDLFFSGQDVINTKLTPTQGTSTKMTSPISSTEDMLIIGEKGAENNKVAIRNLSVASKMEEEGLSPREIRLSTGWERSGVDGKWRYEIDDTQMRFSNDLSQIMEMVDDLE